MKKAGFFFFLSFFFFVLTKKFPLPSRGVFLRLNKTSELFCPKTQMAKHVIILQMGIAIAKMTSRLVMRSTSDK